VANTKDLHQGIKKSIRKLNSINKAERPED